MTAHTRPRSPRCFLWTAVGTLLAATNAGCAIDQEPESDPITELAAPPAKGTVMADFVAHVSPKRGTITFERLIPAPSSGPGLSAQSIDDVNILSDDVAGSGPNNTIELVTNSVGFNADCPAGFQTSTFCGNVTFRHFMGQSLTNVFVQVTAIRDAFGNPLTNHGGINNDSSEFSLGNSLGLWKHTSPSANTAGVLGQSPFNSGDRDWVFSNPDDADTDIVLRAVASLSYESYTLDYSSMPFVDACASGTNLGKISSSTQTLPFPFTLYGTTNSTVKFNKRANITFGSVAGTASGANVNLPSSSAPKPAIFTFWDDIGYGSSASSALCHQTIGAAPNRQYVITWKQMDFVAAADKTASLTFSAVLSEGTNQIDMLYDTMTGPTSRATGDSATVGVQNSSASAATAEYNLGDFGSNNAYAFIPVP